MRKYKLLQGPSLILLIGSLASAQQPRPQPPPQMPGGGGDVFRDEIIANERARLNALKSGNPAALADSISDDAIFVISRAPPPSLRSPKTTRPSS